MATNQKEVVNAEEVQATQEKNTINLISVLEENANTFEQQAKAAAAEVVEAEKQVQNAKNKEIFALGKAQSLRELAEALKNAKDNIDVTL